ncbi:transcriptional regulator [Streptomyces sp. NPDC002521]
MTQSSQRIESPFEPVRFTELVEIRKGYVGQRRCTWVRATAAGRERLRAHLAALQRIADRAEQAAASPDTEFDARGDAQQPHTR